MKSHRPRRLYPAEPDPVRNGRQLHELVQAPVAPMAHRMTAPVFTPVAGAVFSSSYSSGPAYHSVIPQLSEKCSKHNQVLHPLGVRHEPVHHWPHHSHEPRP